MSIRTSPTRADDPMIHDPSRLCDCAARSSVNPEFRHNRQVVRADIAVRHADRTGLPQRLPANDVDYVHSEPAVLGQTRRDHDLIASEPRTIEVNARSVQRAGEMMTSQENPRGVEKGSIRSRRIPRHPRPRPIRSKAFLAGDRIVEGRQVHVSSDDVGPAVVRRTPFTQKRRDLRTNELPLPLRRLEERGAMNAQEPEGGGCTNADKSCSPAERSGPSRSAGRQAEGPSWSSSPRPTRSEPSRAGLPKDRGG